MKYPWLHGWKTLCILLALPVLFTSCGRQNTTTETTASGSFVQEADSASASFGGAVSEKESWKADFENSLLENYGVTPKSYEDLGDGVYQVYVEINGKLVPYVAVDSKTGDYHG